MIKAPKRADQRWEGNEVRISGMDVMVAAGEVVAEFMNEQDGEQSEREGQAAERARMDVCRGA